MGLRRRRTLESLIRGGGVPVAVGAAAPDPDRSEERQAAMRSLLDAVRDRLAREGEESWMGAPDGERRLREAARRLIEEEAARGEGRPLLTAAEKAEVLERLLQAVQGFGLIDPLLRDPQVTEVMINGTDRIFVERGGRLGRAVDRRGRPLRFGGREELMHLIERIVSLANRKVDEASPIVDARLPDGSRACVVLPPVALDGPSVTIRKFREQPLSLGKLVELGSLTAEAAGFLESLVRARCNVLISGGTGTGKTTFLNALSLAVDPAERVVTVEDAAELRLARAENLVRLETRLPNVEGRGAITIRDLVRAALRMRPDRIIVGEVRGGEALDMLQAMNTGHEGSLTTIHANTARDALSRLETMVLLAGVELPLAAVRRQIASAIDFVIHLGRLRDGRRCLFQIAEVGEVEAGEVACRDLFRLEFRGGTGAAPPEAVLAATGEPVRRAEKFAAAGVILPDALIRPGDAHRTGRGKGGEARDGTVAAAVAR